MATDSAALQIKIISSPSEENPFAVVYKPRGLASAPLAPGDDSAFTQAAVLFPALKEVRGLKSVEGGLLHRIDTLTDGLLLIASDQKSYDFFMTEQKEGRFVKEYTALCHHSHLLPEGFPSFSDSGISLTLGSEVTIKSCFRPFGRKGACVRPVVNSLNAGRAALKKAGSREYFTDILIQKTESPDLFKARCRITA
uniref:pseudouridine synthase n=1 Tax=Treponema sp. TaxID=166 RepID=UPI0025FB27F0